MIITRQLFVLEILDLSKYGLSARRFGFPSIPSVLPFHQVIRHKKVFLNPTTSFQRSHCLTEYRQHQFRNYMRSRKQIDFTRERWERWRKKSAQIQIYYKAIQHNFGATDFWPKNKRKKRPTPWRMYLRSWILKD